MATATLFTVMMDWSRPIVGATDYTVQASAVVIASGLGTLISGRIAEHLGYALHFTAAGLIGIASTLLVVAMYPQQRPSTLDPRPSTSAH
jgi:predicted MFS family arabinose efflux permease